MTTQNPIASSDGDASTLDPVDRIQALLDGESVDENGAGDGAADPSKTPDKPKGDAPADDSEPQITTAQLAAFLGIEESEIDVDEDGAPVFKTKIDGKEGAAKFADIRKSHQLGVHAENRTREAVQREQAAERKLQEADQAIQAKFQEQQQSLQQIHAMNAILQEELKGDFQSYNWDELWRADPAQARALERRFADRQTRITNVFQSIGQRDAQARANAEHQRKANEEKGRAAQIQRLSELIPEWKDRAVADKERAEILSWLETSGLDASDIDLNKASQVLMVRKSWQHDTLQKSRPALENRVRSAPKLVKPGQAPSSDGQAANLKSLKQQVKTAKGPNSTKAAAEWLMASGLA